MRNNLLIVGTLILCAVLAFAMTQCLYPRIPDAPITRAPSLTPTQTVSPTVTELPPTETNTPTVTASPTPSATLTPTLQPTDTATPTQMPTETRIPTIQPGRDKITLPTTGASENDEWAWLALAGILFVWAGCAITEQSRRVG